LKPNSIQPCTRREHRGTFLFPKSSTHLHSHQSSRRRHTNCSLTCQCLDRSARRTIKCSRWRKSPDYRRLFRTRLIHGEQRKTTIRMLLQCDLHNLYGWPLWWWTSNRIRRNRQKFKQTRRKTTVIECGWTEHHFFVFCSFRLKSDTHYPHVWAVFTARAYGCRKMHPYVRPVCTAVRTVHFSTPVHKGRRPPRGLRTGSAYRRNR